MQERPKNLLSDMEKVKENNSVSYTTEIMGIK